MRFLPFTIAIAIAALLPRAALAEDDDEWAEYHPPPRLSYGGTAAFRSYAMGDGAADQLVLAPTLALFPLRGVEIDAFLEGAMTIATTCGACRATTWRVGASARWHLAPSSAFDPWLGLQVTYGVVHATGASAEGASETWLDTMAGAEIGFDLLPSRLTHVGPFASAAATGLAIPVDGAYEPPVWAGQTIKYTTGLRAVF